MSEHEHTEPEPDERDEGEGDVPEDQRDDLTTAEDGEPVAPE